MSYNFYKINKPDGLTIGLQFLDYINTLPFDVFHQHLLNGAGIILGDFSLYR